MSCLTFLAKPLWYRHYEIELDLFHIHWYLDLWNVNKFNSISIHEYLSSLQNGLKEADTLLPLLFSFAIRKIKENQVGMKFNETHQLSVYTNL
jgi:hypothetical protein